MASDGLRGTGVSMVVQRDLGKGVPSILDRAYREYKKHLKVEEIMSRNVVTTTTDAPLDEVAKTMGEKHIGSLLVVKYGTPIGIVTERDLLSRILAKGIGLKGTIVDRIMSFPLIKICPTAEIKEAARTMIQKKGRLAVFECGDLVGIITASDLTRSIPEAPETLMTVDEYMTKKVVTVNESTSVATVARIMGEERIGSVIVTREGKPEGIFTERDLLSSFLAHERPLSTPVGDACSSPLITASPGISIHEAAVMMATRHIRRLPLVKKEELMGIITARDLVEAYAK